MRISKFRTFGQMVHMSGTTQVQAVARAEDHRSHLHLEPDSLEDQTGLFKYFHGIRRQGRWTWEQQRGPFVYRQQSYAWT